MAEGTRRRLAAAAARACPERCLQQRGRRGLEATSRRGRVVAGSGPLAPREEVRTEQGYSLDAVVLYGGREVAIEVDGPSHFCGRTPTVATALKRRQLRAAGSALLPVPYWKWDVRPRQERGGQIRVSPGRSTARVA